MKTRKDNSAQGEASVKPKVEHTPTPWFINGGIIGPESIFEHSINFVCSVGIPNHQSEQDTANARFIIRAVNSHEELVNSLRELTNAVNGMCMGKTYQMAVDRARQAIAKAEQK